MAAGSEKIRLSRLMSMRGLSSRREADRLIAEGQVSVDGQVVDVLGSRVSPDADIRLSRAANARQQAKLTIMLNKPVGYVSAQAEKGYPPAVRLVTRDNHYTRDRTRPKLGPAQLKSLVKGLAPAGRLDIDSQGLLILTQDGRIARRLIGPDSRVEKEYLVRVEGGITTGRLRRLQHGLALDGRPLRRAGVEQLNRDQLRMLLTEGRKRQIRRMCELVGLRVTGLKRVRVGALRLGALPEGQWRCVRPAELGMSA